MGHDAGPRNRLRCCATGARRSLLGSEAQPGRPCVSVFELRSDQQRSHHRHATGTVEHDVPRFLHCGFNNIALTCWSSHYAGPLAGYDTGYCAVSPAGDRVAWVLVRTGQDPTIWTLQHLLHRTTKQTGISESIWISTLDGHDWREIGSLRSNLKPPARVYDVYDLEWLPGSKRLAFNYGNTIYTIPAPD